VQIDLIIDAFRSLLTSIEPAPAENDRRDTGS
jgi:hypothetical protein